jgi:hypothetical protein
MTTGAVQPAHRKAAAKVVWFVRPETPSRSHGHPANEFRQQVCGLVMTAQENSGGMHKIAGSGNDATMPAVQRLWGVPDEHGRSVMTHRKHPGLLPEDIAPGTGTLRGNVLPTWSWAGSSSAAMRLSGSWKEGMWHAS